MLELRDLSKKFMVLVVCGVLLLSMQSCAALCTGIYVGPEVSADGSVIIAKSNDYPETWGNHITVTPAVENQTGRFMPINDAETVKFELPPTTYKYTATPYMDSTKVYGNCTTDAAVCTNEYGVAMTMSVTAFANNASLEADPLVEDGICEDTATDLVVCQSKTAREAVETLGGIIDEYGSSESNIALIADQNEAWYVEMYTGHEYAAVKLPKDKVSVFGNEYSLEYLSDYEDSITSKNLTDLAEKNRFAVHGKNNELNIYETYSGKQMTNEYSHMRTWRGHQLLSPSGFGSDYNHGAMYPLCFSPDKNVSAEDVCHVLRDRYEGTKYAPDETGRIDVRVIGTDTALSAHAIQIFKNLPADMSCVGWISIGPPLYGVFVPLSNDCLNVSEPYAANQSANETCVFDTDTYPYYVFKDICTRCVGPDNHKIYGKPVQDYWHEAEGNMFAGMAKVIKQASKMNDSNARAQYITSYCNDMQNKAFEDGKVILNNVTWVQGKNSNTFKIERNPETHQMTGKREVIPPLELNLDASKYKGIPALSDGL